MAVGSVCPQEELSSESSCVAILEARNTLFSFSSFSCLLLDQTSIFFNHLIFSLLLAAEL